MTTFQRFIVSLCVLSLLLPAAVPAVERDSLTLRHWIALPELSPDDVREFIDAYHLRGTHDGVTLALGDAAAYEALAARLPGVSLLASERAGERLFWVFLGDSRDWQPAGEVRVLLRRGAHALVGVPAGLEFDLHALAPQVGRVFHDGLVPVPSRRQRQQPVMPAALGGQAAQFDSDIQSWVDQVSRVNLEADVGTLSTQFESRASNTSGGEAAEDWLVDRFTALGLNVATFSFDSNADNVVAEMPGSLTPERVVIVGAHYDSINFFFGSGAPGADDNASGASALLEIARVLSTSGAQFENTLRFVAFASEEFGLVGSDAYSAFLRDQGTEVVAMLNTDMNAYRASGDTRDLDMVSNNSTDWLNDLLRDISELYQPTFPTREGNLSGGSSDHEPFFNDGFASAFYFEDTGSFSPFIHTGDDELGTSANDFVLAEQIVKSILAGAAVLADPVQSAAPNLSIIGSCPGPITVAVDSLTPGASTAIVTSGQMGSFTIQGGTCGGTLLDLENPKLQTLLEADGSGNVSVSLTAPSSACGTLVQVLDLSNCQDSGVSEI